MSIKIKGLTLVQNYCKITFATSEQSAIPYLHFSLNTRRTSLFLGLLQQVPTAPQYCLQGPQSPVIVLLGSQQLPVNNQSINQSKFKLLIDTVL